MRKLFALLLALAMVVSLCACSNSKKDKDDKERTYKDAVDDFMSAQYKGKTNLIKSLAPKEYWDWREEEYGETAKE